jgi:hypothetical protein
LVLDADEVVPAALAAAIRAALDAPGDRVAYAIPFRNFLGDRWLRHGGLYPDFHVRLFRRAGVHFTRPVHETVVLSGPVGRLEAPIDHHTYRDVDHLMQKVRLYAGRDAAFHAEAGTSVWLLLLKVPWRFLSVYLLKAGFRDGRAGLANALAMTNYAWLLFRGTAKARRRP